MQVEAVETRTLGKSRGRAHGTCCHQFTLTVTTQAGPWAGGQGRAGLLNRGAIPGAERLSNTLPPVPVGGAGAPQVTHNCLLENKASEHRTAGNLGTYPCRCKIPVKILILLYS